MKVDRFAGAAYHRDAALAAYLLPRNSAAMNHAAASVPEDTVRLRIMGPVELVSADHVAYRPTGARQRLLLATLALHAPRFVPADRLVDVLWNDDLPSSPSAALRTQVARLRAVLARVGLADRLRTGEAPGYCLDLRPSEIDCGRFEMLHRQAADESAPLRALALTRSALALCRGEPYADVSEHREFAGEIARLREIVAHTREHAVRCLIDAGHAEDAVAEARTLVNEDPLHERARALMMQSLYQSGRQHDALAEYAEYRRVLSDELGLSPSPALRQLELAILQHTAAPRPPVAGSPLAATAPMAVAEGRPSGAGELQSIRFAQSPDGVRLAYATVGSGPPLVKAANWLNHLEFDWESPVWRRLFRELAARRTLVRYDERACGLSDADAADISLESWVLDLECIVDSCGLERFPLLGISQGCAVCIEYATRHPERVTALILHGGYAAGWRRDERFGAAEIARRDASIEIIRHGWGADTPAYRQMFTQTFIPGGTPAQIAWFNELERRSVTPENAARMMEAFAAIDVRHRLSQVTAPTLVLHSRGDQRIPYAIGRELAAGIPGARFVLLESDNHLILEHEPAFEQWIAEVFRFLAEVEA